jgi:endonuclease/exonuclease/phosphatase family metal-dependent hydrolase
VTSPSISSINHPSGEALSKDEVRVLSWNLEHNGVDPSSGDDARWRSAMETVAAVRPHVVLRQELTGAASLGGRRKWAEAAALGGFHAFVASATPESPNACGVYVDPTLFTPVACYEHSTGWWHPACNPVVRLNGTNTSLSLASAHLCSHDPDQRLHEARRLLTLGKPGMATMIGMDANSYTHNPVEAATLPNWAHVEDRVHQQCRTVTDANGNRVSDTRPDELLSRSHDGRPPVFVDAARHAAEVLGQQKALTPTASLWRTDQGSRQRIDRVYVTPQLCDALISVETLDTEQVRGASDHAPVVVRFDLVALRQTLNAASHR